MEKLFLMNLENSFRISVIFIILYVFSAAIKNRFMSKYKYYSVIFIGASLITPIKFGVNAVKITLYDKSNLIINAFNKSYYINAVDFVNGISIIKLLTCIWLFGAFLFIFKQYYSYIKMIHSMKRWKKQVLNTSFIKIFNEEKKIIGIKKGIDFYISKFIKSPVSVGFLEPAVIIPDTFYSEDEIRLIIRHELVHFKRKDRYANFILLIANAMHWFNPMIYFLNKFFMQECEISCDYQVIEKETIKNKKIYTNLLCMQTERIYHGIGFANNFYNEKSINSKRIISIINKNDYCGGKFILLSVIILVVITGGIVSIPKLKDVSNNNAISLVDDNGNEVNVKVIEN